MLGLAWRSAAADIDEAHYMLDEPLAGALNVALAKARRLSAADMAEVVLAADTLVVSDGLVLGKPADDAQAADMLRRLRGRAHTVMTGVAVRREDGREWGAVVSTDVVMRAYSDGEIATYVARGEPFDKAGGYAIQDTAFRPVERLAGCYLNVVGLPLCALIAGLEAMSVQVSRPADMRPPCELCRAGAARVAIKQVD